MIGLAKAAGAGPIKVEIDGVVQSATYNSFDDIVIDVGTFSGVKRVRVYDSTLFAGDPGDPLNGLPDDVIGKVTVNGSPAATSDTMEFWVSGSPVFPLQSIQPIANLGAFAFGANSADGLTITNPDLRRQTRVAIATVTDIKGDITAGQIFRIQAGIANELGNPLFSGDVSANITAINRDREWINGAGTLKAIEEVNIVGVLSGNLHSADFSGYTPGLESTYANIGRVIVRGTAQYPIWDGTPSGAFNRSTAIVGNILAETGRITEIYSLGSIGAVPEPCPPPQCFAGFRPTILAADGIDRIETRALDNTDPNWLVIAQEADPTIVRATIVANHKNAQANAIEETTIDDDGTIYLIATQGKILGDIVANNLTYDRASPGPFPQRAGIFAREGVQGSIRIEHLVDGADIVSPGGLSSVYIGRQLRGSIVEKVIYVEQGSGSGDPELPGPAQECNLQLVQIGIPDAQAKPLPTYAAKRVPGFVGSFVYLEDPFPTVQKWLPLGQLPGIEGTGSLDSTILAGCIDTLRIANMGIIENLTVGVLNPDPVREFTIQPRVEVVGGGLLEIGELRCGIVRRFVPGVETPDSSFAGWGEVNVGCVGPASELWLASFEYGASLGPLSQIDILGNHMGEIWMPYMLGDDVNGQNLLRVGEGLVAFPSSLGNCECSTPRIDRPCSVEAPTALPPTGAPAGYQQIMSGRRSAIDLPAPTNGEVAGIIEIVYYSQGDNCTIETEVAAFSGQIILHANNTGLTHDLSKWKGAVNIGRFNKCPASQIIPRPFPYTLPISIDTLPDYPGDPYVGPTYTISPAAEIGDGGFGPGAIGLVPFAVHRAASELENDGATTEPPLGPGCEDPIQNFRTPLRSAFNNLNLVCTDEPLRDNYLDIIFYGPVGQAPNVALSPFQLHRVDPNAPCDRQISASEAYFVADIDQSDRRVRLLAIQNMMIELPGGVYELAPWPNSPNGTPSGRSMRCKDLLTPNAVVLPLNFNQNSGANADREYFRLQYVCASQGPEQCIVATSPACDTTVGNYGCDGVDFNNDGSFFDPGDIDAFLSVFSEGPCIPETAICNDVDFNNDGSLFDPCDVDAFLVVFSEGPCTPCGQ